MIELLFVALVERLASAVEPVWEAYARVLNLPIVIGAVLDGVLGVALGVRMFGSESVGTALVGIVVTAAAGLFAGASVVTWVGKVREEREDAEHRLRRPERRGLPGGSRAG